MGGNYLYSFFKGFTDSCIKIIYKILPEWKEEGVEVLPAVAPTSPKLPVNFDSLPPQVAKYFQESTGLPARHIYRLKHVHVSWQTIIFRNLRIFLKGLPHPREEKHYTDAYLLKQWVVDPVELPPTVNQAALVHDLWSVDNYYHWIADSLPRLLILRQLYPACLLLVPEPIPEYVRTSTSLLGFKHLLPIQDKQIVKVPLLLLSEYAAPPGFQDASLMRQLRAEITKAIGHQPPPQPHRRLYISRARQNNRRLVNEAAIIPILTQYGFEVVYFEGLEFAQQVQLMQEAAVVMGIHGANLTNILFMQPSTTVIELINEEKLVVLDNQDFENLIYYRMAFNMQLHYYNAPCKPSVKGDITNRADVIVDEYLLNEILINLK
ncbi:glycosyltransferase family 61 protein [Hymenobacter radiodurans]|uniref:glycosyltransferase family 61 protein n=1 Tax=Hymenobacter radiodurans TaxID=2496028 RepID=UPI001059198B|nr:glycosyltransferase family 61 protein [Hymenobacter radiodurans]